MLQIRAESFNILEFCFKAELSQLFSQERPMKDGGELCVYPFQARVVRLGWVSWTVAVSWTDP